MQSWKKGKRKKETFLRELVMYICCTPHMDIAISLLVVLAWFTLQLPVCGYTCTVCVKLWQPVALLGGTTVDQPGYGRPRSWERTACHIVGEASFLQNRASFLHAVRVMRTTSWCLPFLGSTFGGRLAADRGSCCSCSSCFHGAKGDVVGIYKRLGWGVGLN